MRRIYYVRTMGYPGSHVWLTDGLVSGYSSTWRFIAYNNARFIIHSIA